MEISSSVEEGKSGTVVIARFDTKSIDCMPMGDIVSTVTVLISGSPDIDFVFCDSDGKRRVFLDTRDLREVLGDEVSLAEPEVQVWMSEYLKEQYNI